MLGVDVEAGGPRPARRTSRRRDGGRGSGAVLIAVEGSGFPDGLGWGRLALVWLVAVAFLLAIARLATLAVRGLVDTEPRT